MTKKRRWARLDENNSVVEFTRVNPFERFHPSIRWVEVDEDTKMFTRLTILGSEIKYNPDEVVGQPIDLHEAWLRAQQREKDLEEKMNSKPKEVSVSEYTIDLDPELKSL